MGQPLQLLEHAIVELRLVVVWRRIPWASWALTLATLFALWPLVAAHSSNLGAPPSDRVRQLPDSTMEAAIQAGCGSAAPLEFRQSPGSKPEVTGPLLLAEGPEPVPRGVILLPCRRVPLDGRGRGFHRAHGGGGSYLTDSEVFSLTMVLEEPWSITQGQESE